MLEALRAADEIAWRYFLLAFHSGMRTGELLGLDWSATTERPCLVVGQTRVRRRVKAHTKTGDQRRIMLPPVAWDMLASNPTRFRKSFVFLTPIGHPFLDADWLMDKWRAAHTAAKIRRRTMPYPWRHTYVSLALAAGASMVWVSKQTGDDISTLERHYARWVEGRLDADAAELAKVYR